LLRGELRLTTVVVRYIWPTILEVAVDDVSRIRRDVDRPLSLAAVLERGIGVGPVE